MVMRESELPPGFWKAIAQAAIIAVAGAVLYFMGNSL
jgi:hypothetical protein